MQISSVKEILDGKISPLSPVTIRGWVRFNRLSGKIGFIELNDGSSLNNIQIVYKKISTKGFDETSKLRTGSSILVNGKTNTNKDSFEVLAEEIIVLKDSAEDYPLQKKEHSMEFLRDIAHLRGRTQTMTSIMTVRSKLAFAIHKFFNENGFKWISTPIITSNDAEGAGENFVIEQTKEEPFFDKEAKLTVSGQLNAEAYSQAFQKVYTFGPTFRAERSHTNRHLAEFWMIEPEIAFIDLSQLMAIIEAFIKSIINYVCINCKDEINFFVKQKPFLNERIDTLLKKNFIKLEYKEAIEILKKAAQDKIFEDNNIFFGKDIASEHERYLCEQVYKAPVFLYNFPKEIKAFYMKVNSDNKTVAATDLLVPGVGEIVGGSQREDDYDKLTNRTKELNMDISSIKWYLDLRKYGYSLGAGFGLGFERLIMYILGLDNIRDTIPFPRYNGKLNF